MEANPLMLASWQKYYREPFEGETDYTLEVDVGHRYFQQV